MQSMNLFILFLLLISAVQSQATVLKQEIASCGWLLSNNSNPLDLYPKIEPYFTGYLDVSGGHRLYYEESGNSKGKPMLFLHGGPGSGTNPGQRRFFDPALYRIILLDQRGAGKSVAQDPIMQNTTEDLIEDIETLRKHLNVKQLQFFGISWGSTLAILYAKKYPQNVSAMVLHSLFLGRKSDSEHVFQSGALEKYFPEAWARFIEAVRPEERSALVETYFKRMRSENREERIAAVTEWTEFENSIGGSFSSSIHIKLRKSKLDDIYRRRGTIEAHYILNQFFLDEGHQISEGLDRIRHIPTFGIHGRLDMVTPVSGALSLEKKWPELELHLLPYAGHLASEPGATHQIISITNNLVH